MYLNRVCTVICPHILALLQQPSNVPHIATHMLVFMVRALFPLLEFPYAEFPTSSLSGGILYPQVWECIAHLEMIGFKVLAVTADGTSPNCKWIKGHIHQ